MLDIEKLAYDLSIVELTHILDSKYKNTDITTERIYGLFQEIYDNYIYVIDSGTADRN